MVEGLGVVDLLGARGAHSPGEGVGRRHQMHGLPMSVGDLVGVDGCLVGEVEHGP